MARLILLSALIAILCCCNPVLIPSVSAAPVDSSASVEMSSVASDATEPTDSVDETDAATNAPPASNAPSTNAGSETEAPEESSTNAPEGSVTQQSASSIEGSENSESSTSQPNSASTTSIMWNNSTCSDIRSDCDSSRCNDDHTRFLCANTCGSCQLRDQCYNAYGDDVCHDLDFLCDSLPIVQVVCKKACGQCQSAANDCQDVSKNCDASQCSVKNNNLWCGRTCGTCADAAKCQDALDANTCSAAKSSNLCSSSPYFQVMCKKSCSSC